MKLMTAQLKKKLPALGTQEENPDPMVWAKFFDPCGRLTFFVLEFDGDDTLFGFMVSPLGEDCDELGYSSLAELQAIRTRFGLGIERDINFKPVPLSEAKAQIYGVR